MNVRLFRALAGSAAAWLVVGCLCACETEADGAPAAADASAVISGQDAAGSGAGQDASQSIPGPVDGGSLDGQVADTGAQGLDSAAPSATDGGERGDAGGLVSPADAGAQDASSTPDSSAPATCLATASLAAGEKNRSVSVGGVSRSYLLHVPPSYTGKTPVPLVLDWHGLLLDGATQRVLSGYAELADREGFIVAFPDGIDAAWNVGPCCTTSRDVDDVGFARALVAEIEKLGCIDVKRVYSVGFSMGGGMTHLLACRAADLFAAVAPAAFDLLAADEQPCQPSRPISVISFRGRDDFIVPYEGGASNPPNGLPVTIHFRGARATFDFWKEANRCSGSPTTMNGCETYATCAAGVQTTLCTTEGIGGHVPGDPELGWAALKRYTLP